MNMSCNALGSAFDLATHYVLLSVSLDTLLVTPLRHPVS